ncbi:MAG: hypothetical protein ACKO1X_02360 [Acidimicrobiales bacterium]
MLEKPARRDHQGARVMRHCREGIGGPEGEFDRVGAVRTGDVPQELEGVHADTLLTGIGASAPFK